MVILVLVLCAFHEDMHNKDFYMFA